MPYDYGLVGGIGQGIQQGLLTYMKAKQMNRENQIQNLTAGVETDEDGNLKLNPQEQAKRQAQAQQMQNQGLLQQGQLAAQKRQQDEYDAEAPLRAATLKHQQDIIDPESSDSQNYYKGLVGSGMKSVPQGLSESQYKEQFPIYEAKMHSDALKSALGTRQDDKLEKDWQTIAQRLNDPSSRAAMGRYQQNLDKVNSFQQMINQVGVQEGQLPPPNETREQRIARLDKANPNQLYESAKSADLMMSPGGQGSVYGSDHMMPKAMEIDAARLHQWINGGPAPAHAGKFLNTFYDLMQREGSYNKQARDSAIAGLGVGYRRLQKNDPQRWEDLLSASNHNMGVTGLVQQQPTQPPSPTGSNQGPQIAAGKRAAPNIGDTVPGYEGFEYAGGPPDDPRSWKAKQSIGGLINNFLHGSMGGR